MEEEIGKNGLKKEDVYRLSKIINQLNELTRAYRIGKINFGKTGTVLDSASSIWSISLNPSRATNVYGCLVSLKPLLKNKKVIQQEYNPSIINPILIQVYPRKWGWPDLLHSNSNISSSHSPSWSIHGILLPQTNTLALLLHLCLPNWWIRFQWKKKSYCA